MKDVVIIGAGIAGMTAALYLKRGNKDVLLIEKGIPGGAINTASTVKNYPGVNVISGPDFGSLLFNQITENKIDVKFSTVLNIENYEDKKVVVLPNDKIECKYIIIATGKETRKLNVPNEQELTGHGISYCALCDGPLYKNKNVAVVGTGDAALEEALFLADICKKVTILAKYDYFKCQEHILNDVKKKKNIHILYSSMVTEFIAKDNKLSSLKYKHDDKISSLKVDGCFIYIGSTPNIFASLNMELDGNYVKVDNNMETSIKGIYAAGDIVKKNLYQLVTASSDGALAATSILKELNKR